MGKRKRDWAPLLEQADDRKRGPITGRKDHRLPSWERLLEIDRQAEQATARQQQAIAAPAVAADDRTDRPAHVPAKNWQRAVSHVQTHAREFPHFWPCWVKTWRRFLRRISDGSRGDVFNRLYMVYLASGGTGSTFCRSTGTEVTGADVADATPGVAADGRAVVDATENTLDGSGPQGVADGPDGRGNRRYFRTQMPESPKGTP